MSQEDEGNEERSERKKVKNEEKKKKEKDKEEEEKDGLGGGCLQAPDRLHVSARCSCGVAECLQAAN